MTIKTRLDYASIFSSMIEIISDIREGIEDGDEQRGASHVGLNYVKIDQKLILTRLSCLFFYTKTK